MSSEKGSRVGVFLCRCGGQMGLSFDESGLRSYAEGLPDVVHVQTHDYLCHDHGVDDIVHAIRNHKLDRIVVAACSPRIYLERFQEAAAKGGLNRMMVEMANIREQGAWVHFQDRGSASRKAEDQLAMSVAKVRNAVPYDFDNVAVVNQDRCTGCGICESVCNVNAVKVAPDEKYEGKRRATVNPKACVGCGACVAACPTSALDQIAFTNKQVLAQIETALARKNENGEPNILVFSCHWCSYTSADMAGLKRMAIDPHFRAIRVMCSARVDPEWILKAMSLGADGILVLAGKPGRCHFEVGNLRTRKRMKLLQMVFQEYGFDENRFQIRFVDSEQEELYARTINEYVATIRELGPNPIEPTTIIDPKRIEVPELKLR